MLLNFQVNFLVILYVSFEGCGKMNFGFDGSDTEPTSVDPLASKSRGKKARQG
jgi:hypothetical protein